MVTSLPNILTYSRIAIIPLVMATFYFDGPAPRWVACALFAVAAITDFFDGYLARSRNQVSTLGRFLDPIADKLLVASVLLMLAGYHRISAWAFLPAVVILCREILVSGLREFLAELRISVPVTRLAKWKTALQLVALPVLIVGEAGPDWLPTQALGELCLWLAAVATIITGYDYMKAGVAHLKDHRPPPAAPAPAPAVGSVEP